MSKLQNNFTTVEQSKRLLELGVSADSADCYWQLRSDTLADNWGYRCYIGTSPAIKDNLYSYRNGYTIPCWSVGRLIEILEIIIGSPWSDHEELGKSTLVERVLRDFEDVVRYKEIFKDNRIDFSKLND